MTHDGSDHQDSVPRDRLDAGLRAAFGPDPDVSDEEVGDFLRASGLIDGIAPPFLGVDADPSVPCTLTTSELSDFPVQMGRYRLLGEIARGGVGAVYRARDEKLGRNLAIKILLDAHKGNAALVHRFVEEAQIAGQLQHPGIAPVHDVGTLDDGTPYFTMKLVEGRTLSELLDERESPEDERERFLGLFEKLCQTLGFAHSRGVIHRDVKPANVMVGSFGEVQVMDWGFAKVLSRSEAASRVDRVGVDSAVIETVRTGRPGFQSLAGSVLGTPAYMSPEQASGRLHDLDERSDVFGLGAVLCEILTGKPPYTGETASEIHEQAKACRIEPALRRIDETGASADLVALAKECLALRPEERPRDAGNAAERMAAHLSSTERRARQAEAEALTARVKARGERKARWLTVVLAAAVVVAVVGVVGYLRVTESLRRQLDHAITSVEDLRRKAIESRLSDPAWGVYRGAVADAVAMAEASGDAEQLSRARALVTRAERDGVNAQGLADLEQLRARETLKATASSAIPYLQNNQFVDASSLRAFRLPDGGGVAGTSASVADLDGDGDQDIAIGLEQLVDGGPVRIYMNGEPETSSLAFGAFVDVTKRHFPPGATAFTEGVTRVLLHDMNGDERPDLIVASGGDARSSIRVFYNEGAGVFPSEAVVAVISSWRPTRLQADDLDGDGDEDLIVAATGLSGEPPDEGVRLLRNDHPRATFTDVTAERLPRLPTGDPDAPKAGASGLFFAAGDVDRDGDIDLVVGYRSGPRMHLCVNDGRGSFELAEASVMPSPAADTVAALLADLDGDGRLDLVSKEAEGTLRVYRNSSERPPDFSAEPQLVPGTLSPLLAAGDIDEDGDLDIVSAGQRTAVYLNTGGFLELAGGRVFFEEGFEPARCLALADMDMDVDLDLVMVTGRGPLRLTINLHRQIDASPVVSAGDELELDLYYRPGYGTDSAFFPMFITLTPLTERKKSKGGFQGLPDAAPFPSPLLTPGRTRVTRRVPASQPGTETYWQALAIPMNQQTHARFTNVLRIRH